MTSYTGNKRKVLEGLLEVRLGTLSGLLRVGSGSKIACIFMLLIMRKNSCSGNRKEHQNINPICLGRRAQCALTAEIALKTQKNEKKNFLFAFSFSWELACLKHFQIFPQKVHNWLNCLF